MKPNPAKNNRTRQATASVMALALGAAVYLNWSFARAAPQDLTVGAIADGTAQEVSAVIDPLTDDTAVETVSFFSEVYASVVFAPAAVPNLTIADRNFFDFRRLGESVCRQDFSIRQGI